MRELWTWRRLLVWVAGIGAGVGGLVAEAQGQGAAADFKANCASCHTIGGGTLMGPDLKDAHQRQDRAWLVRFIVDPQAVIDSGDPYAQKILREARGVVMPKVAGMTQVRAEALLALIESESQLPKSQFAGMQLSDRPFLPADVEAGRMLFTGRTRTVNGGAACVACHSIGSLGGMGGGTLAPDLTKVYERLGGRNALASWLDAPPTTTMQAIFARQRLESEEILSLVALFQDEARNQSQGRPGIMLVVLGLAGAAGMLWGLNRLWRGRLSSVREQLIRRSALEGESR